MNITVDFMSHTQSHKSTNTEREREREREREGMMEITNLVHGAGALSHLTKRYLHTLNP